MITIENTRVMGFEMAVKGARNPMNSRDQSDSYFPDDQFSAAFVMGEKDLALLTRLSKAGPDHGKFMRMIHVQCDITAPLFWFKEQETYKVGTVANSTSTMHKIHAKKFVTEDFSCETLQGDAFSTFMSVINSLNKLRDKYLVTKDKETWRQMIELLPSSYNQTRTIDWSYAVLKNIYHARKGHKLYEWEELRKWIETLPYARQLICGEV